MFICELIVGLCGSEALSSKKQTARTKMTLHFGYEFIVRSGSSELLGQNSSCQRPHISRIAKRLT
jgi:hypothetical protein